MIKPPKLWVTSSTLSTINSWRCNHFRYCISVIIPTLWTIWKSHPRRVITYWSWSSSTNLKQLQGRSITIIIFSSLMKDKWILSNWLNSLTTQFRIGYQRPMGKMRKRRRALSDRADWKNRTEEKDYQGESPALTATLPWTIVSKLD